MHEYTIVQSMLDLCEKHSKGKEIDKIVVKIGKMSGIEPHFLKESFEIFKEDTVCHNATMEMKIIEIKIRCQSCKRDTIINDFNFYCPFCNSGDTKILTGQEMHIDYIELKE